MSKRNRDSRSEDQWLQIQINALKRRLPPTPFTTGGGGGATGANPTAQVILTAVNGAAATFMRSDAAPPLSQAISPTMTGTWNFTPTFNTTPITVNANNLTTSPMQAWHPNDGIDTVVTVAGDVGIADPFADVVANLSIKGRGAESPIPDLGPLAWYPVGNYDGASTWTDESGNAYHLTAKGKYRDLTASLKRPSIFEDVVVSNYAGTDGGPSTDDYGYFQNDGVNYPSLGSTNGFTLGFIIRDFGSSAWGDNSGRNLILAVPSGSYITCSQGSADGTIAGTTRVAFNVGGVATFNTIPQSHTDDDDVEVWVIRQAQTTGVLKALKDGVDVSDPSGVSIQSNVYDLIMTNQAFVPWKGTGLGEWVIFNRYLSDAEATTLSDYLIAVSEGGGGGSAAQPLTHWKRTDGSVDSIVTADLDWGIGTETPEEKHHVIGNGKYEGYVEFVEIVASGTPATNSVRLYARDSGSGYSNLYFRRDDGAEIDLSVAAAGGGTVTHTTGALTSNLVILGNGGSDIKTLPTTLAGKFLRDDSTWQTIPGGGDALTANPLSQFAATTSAQLAGVMTDETGSSGSGKLVFNFQPRLKHIFLEDPASGFLTDIDTASVTAHQTIQITDANPTNNYMVTGAPSNVDQITVWDPIYFNSVMGYEWLAVDRTRRLLVIGNDASVGLGMENGIQLRWTDGVSTRDAYIRIDTSGSSGIVNMDAMGPNGRWVMTGNTSSAVLTVVGSTGISSSVYNKVAITDPGVFGTTLTIFAAKVFTVSNTMTFTSTDGANVNFGAGGTVLYSASLPSAGNPVTPSVKLTVTNGVATTYMRSDAVLALDVGIIPTWTGAHTFNAGLTTTTINKVTITAPATSATLTIANGKTLTQSNTLTYTGTDGSSVAFGAGGTVLYTSAIGVTVQAFDSDLTTWAGVTPAAGIATFLATPSSANLAAAITDENGTGKLIFSDGTLAIASGKTLTVSNSLTFTGTDGSSVAFGTGGTVLYTSAIGVTVQAFDSDLTTWAGVTPAAGIATFLATPTSANFAAAVTDELGSGRVIFSAGTLNITTGKTLNVSNTMTLTATDGSTVAFGAGGTVLYANQTITLSGDVSGSGSTAITTTIGNNVVTYAKMQDVSATSRFLGRITAGAGDTEELTGTQATTLLNVFTSSLKGLVPASGGGTTTFLRADGTFAAPPGGGGGSGSFTLDLTTSSSTGIIYKDTTTPYQWIHDYTNPTAHAAGTQMRNIWWGKNAGNFSLTGTSVQGANNIGIGDDVLSTGTTANQNVAIGWGSMSLATSARYNVAVGAGSLQSLGTGESNVAIGSSCLTYVTANRCIGIGDTAGDLHATGDDSIFIGFGAASDLGTETNAIAIGSGTIVGSDNKAVIGNLSQTMCEIRGDLQLFDTSGSGFFVTIQTYGQPADASVQILDSGVVWVDNYTNKLTAVDTPILTWAPSASPVGFRLTAGSRQATSSTTTLGVWTFGVTGGTGRYVFASTGASDPLFEVQGSFKATKVNLVTITQPATGATLTIADGKTVTQNNTITYGGTDGSSVAFGAGGTVLYTSAIGSTVQAFDADLTTWAGITPAAGIGTFLATPNSANLAAAITDENGTGKVIFSAGTLNIVSGKTLTVNDTATIQDAGTYRLNPVGVATSADFNVASVTDIAIATETVAGLAAGDIVIVEGSFTILNNSTAARQYTVTVDFDGVFDIELVTNGVAFSATLIHPFWFRAVLDIRSTSLSYCVWELTGMPIAGLVSGADVTMNTTSLHAMSWGTSGSNLTGSTNVTLACRSANATATQTFRLHHMTVSKHSPV